MKKIGKIKLINLSKAELEAREMNILKGGTLCSCSCTSDYMKAITYDAVMGFTGGGTDDDLCICNCSGTSSTGANSSANIEGGYGSSGDGNGNCTCACGVSQNGDNVRFYTY